MTYQEAVHYLFTRLPMFHRVGAAAYKANLDNINALSKLLNHPEKNFKSVHVAGTNGKGSVSHSLASIMQEAGYKTGLFTSPHLKDYRERIRINGKMIKEETVVKFLENYKQSFDKIQPSFFEWTTALAFDFFSKEKVDVAVIETGLGGRLDSTNIITPELSVITNISYDHMYLLGDTIEKIAGEKAGIIKKNIPVIIGERNAEYENVFIKKAEEMHAEITFASDHFKAEKLSLTDNGQIFRIYRDGKILYDELEIDLLGNYQEKNVCTILQSVEELQKKFPAINSDHIKNGLKNVQANTGLLGRWQIIGKNPMTIVDVGHNEGGLKYVMEQLRFTLSKAKLKSPDAVLHIVFGIVNDKDPSIVLQLLPKDAEYYFCKADIPRALDAEELSRIAFGFGLMGKNYPSVIEAYNASRNSANREDVIFVGGSTFVVGEII